MINYKLAKQLIDVVLVIGFMVFLVQFVLAFFGMAFINGFVSFLAMISCFGLRKVLSKIYKGR